MRARGAHGNNPPLLSDTQCSRAPPPPSPYIYGRVTNHHSQPSPPFPVPLFYPRPPSLLSSRVSFSRIPSSLMALCGIAAFHPMVDGCDSRRLRWPSLLGEPSPPWFLVGSPALRGWRARCSSGKIASGPESRGTAGRTGGFSAVEDAAPPEEEDVGPGIKFKMSDFAVSDQVSVGLQGRVRGFLSFRI